MNPEKKARNVVCGTGCAVVLGVVAFLIATVIWVLGSLFGGMCGNDIVSSVLSPDRQLQAVVFQRDCGATTGFSTQVSVLLASKRLPNDGGNTFVADTNHGVAPRGPGGGPKVDVRWEGNRRVLVVYDPSARVFSSITRVRISTGLFRGERVTIRFVASKGGSGVPPLREGKISQPQSH